ncbi:MAG: DUF3015 family protein [Bacteriovoracaceae bacterium]|nr:DUF3015 family protein [Bacteriovoracaceae bacterium]
MFTKWLPFLLGFLVTFNSFAETKTTTKSKRSASIEESTPSEDAPKPRKKKKGLIQEMSGQGYGMSGCGLGSILFGEDNSVGIQIFSSTTNYTAYNQTFALTSGTSNCNPNYGSEEADATLKNTLKYVESNFISLKNDVAKNQGQTLAGLGGVLGCTDNQELGSLLQSNYETIYPTTNKSANGNEALHAGNAIFHLVESNSNLKNNCKI